jgi:RNA-directed DNA polymerase
VGKSSEQETLINNLNPVIVGWANYYSTVVSKEIFVKVGYVLFNKLFAWAKRRHSQKSKKWIADKYWRINQLGWIFQARNNEARLFKHSETPIKRYTKVQGTRSPFDGDWVYWSTRLGRHPEISPRAARLLKRQKGKCQECNLFFKTNDLIEVDHIIPEKLGGLDIYNNLQLLHRHCHDKKTARETRAERYA